MMKLLKIINRILFTPILKNITSKKTDKKSMIIFLIFTVVSGTLAFLIKHNLFFFIFFVLATTSYIGRLLALITQKKPSKN